MLTLKNTRIAAAILFITVLFSAAAYNATTNKANLAWIAGQLRPFESLQRFRSDMTELDHSLASNVAGKAWLRELHGRLYAMTGKRMLGAWPVVKLPDGSLNSIDMLPPDYPSLQLYSSYFHHLKNLAADGGAAVLYVNPPDRIIRNATPVPAGVPIQDQNSVEDSILFYMREYDVPYLDARDLFPATGLNPQHIVYKTGYGWTPPAAFETFKGIVSTLEKRNGLILDPEQFYRDPANYDWQTLPNAFYGEYGRNTGSAFSGKDDFTFFLPKFERNYTVDMIDPDGTFTSVFGPTRESLLNPDELELKADPDLYSPANVYLGPPKAWVQIQNNDNPTGKRLLVVSDVFGPPLTALLAPLFGQTHAIWVYDGESSVNIHKYLAGQRFDTVLFIVSPGSYYANTMRHFTDKGVPAIR